MTNTGRTRSWETAWTPTEFARGGGVDIAYDRLAGSEGEPLLLIMGLGVSRFWWPTGLAQAFADQGFAVARYDQRDAGQSSRMPDSGGSNPFTAVIRKRGAYSSEDMTDDAVAVLDALGWERAHVFGASLGGVIAQRLALRHPDRVLSVVAAASLPSDVSGLGGGRYVRFGLLARLARAKFPRAGRVTSRSGSCWPGPSRGRPIRSTRTRRGSGSSGRSTRGRGTRRHRAGRPARPGTGGSSVTCTNPSSVLHGDQDPILRVSAARATAKAIDGARLVILPGAGHDLPEPLWPVIAREVRDLAGRSHAAAATNAPPPPGLAAHLRRPG